MAHFWTVEYALGSPFSARTLPHPTTHVVFEMGHGGRAAQVAFPHTSRFERRLEGTGFVFGVKLRPAMAGAFYPAHAARLRGRVLRLEAVFSPVVAPLAQAIFEADRFKRRVEVATELLCRSRPVTSAELELARDVVERVEADRSLTTVGDVARTAGLAVRVLQRLFAAKVGVTPKWVLQRYRLHEAAARLEASAPPSLASLAAELGYADQAHFTRDFSTVVGCSPRAYAHRARAR